MVDTEDLDDDSTVGNNSSSTTTTPCQRQPITPMLVCLFSYLSYKVYNTTNHILPGCWHY